MDGKVDRVIVYVEGPSDKNTMQVLLEPLILRKQEAGISIEFYETTEGDRKTTLLTKVPIRAVNILHNNPGAVVVAMPDLYPCNKGFPHQTYNELVEGIMQKFEETLQRKGLSDQRLRERFKVFCFKHDLEALILAAEESLHCIFHNKPLRISWRKPVVDQDLEYPPKKIVEEIYKQQGQRYKDTIDAPLVLRGVSYQDICERCPQCFNPFVEFLEALPE